MTRLLKIAALGIAVYAGATKGGRERLKRAQETYKNEVASGARPIEAVGTAVAAFIGLANGSPSDTPRSPGVVVEEVPEPPRPINLPGTSTASRGESDPEKP